MMTFLIVVISVLVDKRKKKTVASGEWNRWVAAATNTSCIYQIWMVYVRACVCERVRVLDESAFKHQQ